MKTTITNIILSLTVLLLFNTESFAATNTTIMAPPSNDLIENAINLGFGPSPYYEDDVNFPEATGLNDSGGQNCSAGSPGVWYKFTATKIGFVIAGIVAPNAASALFYEGPENATTGSDLIWVDQPENPCALNPLVGITTSIGITYFIYMTNQAVSDVSIDVSAAFAAPSNDLITFAAEVAVSNPTNTYENIHFFMASDSFDGGQEGCDTEENPGIWYKFYSEVVMDISATMSSGSNNSVIIFYKSLHDSTAQNGSDTEHVVQPQNQCGIQNSASITTEADNWHYIFASTAEPYASVTVDSMVLGVSENELEEFSYYPNPVTNEINLSAKNTIDQVSIFNILGQNVYEEKINNAKSSINLSFLEQGMYVMKVSAGGSTATYKIVKQ